MIFLVSDCFDKEIVSTLSKIPTLSQDLPPVAHVLRACNDFVNIVLNPKPKEPLQQPQTTAPVAPSVEHLFQFCRALLASPMGSLNWLTAGFDFVSLLV